jgi:hypothetical protein
MKIVYLNKGVLTASMLFSSVEELITIERVSPDRYVMKGYPKSNGIDKPCNRSLNYNQWSYGKKT